MKSLSTERIAKLLAAFSDKNLEGIVGIIVINKDLNCGMDGDLRFLALAAKEATLQYELAVCDMIRAASAVASEDKEAKEEGT